jgi:hypothetical protein
LNGDPTEHVRDYFIAMGAEACQIAARDIHASGEVGGPVNGSVTVTNTFPASVSLVRAIDGIDVAESIAWAQFDVQDQRPQPIAECDRGFDYVRYKSNAR